MALNEFEMNEVSEGSIGTGGRVDELTLPVDTSQRSRSPQTHANEEDLDLELNLQRKTIGAGPSGGRREDDELVHPLSESRSEPDVEGQCHVTCLEPIREEDEEDEGDDGGMTHQPAGDPKNTDHSVTEEESDRICRTCGPDEETDEEIPEPDNLLVKLGCKCRGSLCRMHRKCIIEWYGPRMYQENNYKCELCNTLLHGRIESLVYRAFIGHDSGGDILFKALGSQEPRRSGRPRRNRNANVVQAAPADGNARPDSHQIQIVEIMHPGSRRTRNQPVYRAHDGSSRGGYPMCVVLFVIVVLIGLWVACVGELRRGY